MGNHFMQVKDLYTTFIQLYISLGVEFGTQPPIRTSDTPSALPPFAAFPASSSYQSTGASIPGRISPTQQQTTQCLLEPQTQTVTDNQPLHQSEPPGVEYTAEEVKQWEAEQEQWEAEQAAQIRPCPQDIGSEHQQEQQQDDAPATPVYEHPHDWPDTDGVVAAAPDRSAVPEDEDTAIADTAPEEEVAGTSPQQLPPPLPAALLVPPTSNPPPSLGRGLMLVWPELNQRSALVQEESVSPSLMVAKPKPKPRPRSPGRVFVATGMKRPQTDDVPAPAEKRRAPTTPKHRPTPEQRQTQEAEFAAAAATRSSSSDQPAIPPTQQHSQQPRVPPTPPPPRRGVTFVEEEQTPDGLQSFYDERSDMGFLRAFDDSAGEPELERPRHLTQRFLE